MKKIMFNDRYGLTNSVLRGDKTMTRRIIPIDLYNQTDWKAVAEGDFEAVVDGEGYYHDIRNCGKYRVGEEIAIAQSYESVYLSMDISYRHDYLVRLAAYYKTDDICNIPGWTNKMFVKAVHMPNRIRIINVNVERLQDISEDDAMREGIYKYDKPPLCHEYDMFAPWPPYVKPYKYDLDNLEYFSTTRNAFHSLINKISGKGTWERNPWVYAYTFELTH